MSYSFQSIKLNLTYVMLLSAMAGGVLATGIVIVLTSDQAVEMHPAPWQIAAIYAATIPASVFLGWKGATKKHVDDGPNAGSGDKSSQSNPS